MGGWECLRGGSLPLEQKVSTVHVYICVCLPDTASFADKRNIQTHQNSAACSVPPRVVFFMSDSISSPGYDSYYSHYFGINS